MPAVPEYIPLSKGKALFAVASWRSGSTTNTPACTAANLTDNDGKAGTHVNSGDVTKNNNNNHTNNNNNGKASTNSRGNNTRSGTRGRNGRRGGAGGHGGKDNSGRSAAPAAADVDDFFVHILFPGDAQVDSFHFDLKAQATPLRVFDIGKRRPLLPRSAGEGRGRDAAASSASHSHTNRLVSDNNRVTDEDTSRHASSNPINHHGAARGRAGEADDSSPVQAPNQDDVEVVAAHEGGSNHRALCDRDAATSAQARSPACVSTLIEVSEHDAASEGGEGAKEHFSPTSPCAGGEVSPLQTASAAAAAAAATGNSPGDAVPQMQLPPAEILPETHRTSSLLSYHRSCNGDSNSVNVGEEGAGDVEYKEYDSPNREAEKVRRSSSSSSDVENEVSPSLAAVSSNGAASGPATTRTTTTSVHDKEQEELQDDYLISLLFAENEEAQSAASLIARRWPQAKVEVVARNRATLSASLVLKFMPTLIKTSEAVEELATFPHKPSYVRLYRSTRNVYQNVLFVKYPNREAAEDSKLRLMRCYIKTHPLKVDFKRRYNNGGGAGGGTEAGESATDTKPLPQMIRELRVSNEHEGVAFKRADLSRDELKTLKQLCQSYDLIFEMNDQRVTARRQLKGSGPSKSISPALRPQGVAGCHSTPSWAPTTPAPLRPMDFKGISHWKDMQNQSNSLGIIRPIGPGSGVAAFSAGRGRQI